MSNKRTEYKMTELGEIPIEWEIKSISDIFNLYGCMSLSRAKTGEGDTFYLHYGDIHKSKKNIFDTTVDSEWIPKINSNEVKLKTEAMLETGDVVFADASEDYADIAKNVVVKIGAEDKFVAGLHTIVIREKYEPLDFHFKAYAFKIHEVRKQMQVLATGTTVLGISKPNLGKIKFILPPIEEQQKIGSILSTVDEQIDETEQLIVKTKELKKGLMQQLLTKGIGHTEFKHTELGEIPSEWQIVQLDEVADVKGGKRLPKGKQLVEYDTGYPYIRVSDMNSKGVSLENIMYVPKEIAPAISNYKIFKGELYISVAGTIGLVGIVPDKLDGANLTENANRICNINVDVKYLKYFLESNLIQNVIKNVRTTSAQPKLALNQIKSFKIFKPSLHEQQKIATTLSTIDEQIEAYEEEKVKYEELKKGLMQQLLTGQIRVKY